MISKMFNLNTRGLYVFVVVLFLLTLLNSVETQVMRCTQENQKFLCKNQRCIWSHFVCDGENDCQDNSDEESCESKPCNQTTHFRCNNQVCVPREWLCDGTNDCKDNSDEHNCQNCTSNQFRCQNGNCIQNAWKCDGEDDCKDNSDEVNCPVKTCPSNQFQCSNGDCIIAEWKCDGDIDCQDGSDEHNCPARNCTANDQFTCRSSGRCISKDYVCDEDADCLDNSDEENCTPSQALCPVGHYTCSSSYGGITECLMDSWVCDGDYDCANGADEKDCHPKHCTADQFACDPLTCIPLSSRCDGNRDCLDGSDEAGCSSDRDEINCNPTTTFRCEDKSKCILKTKLCNHFIDCPDESDEKHGFGYCFSNECKMNNGNCSDICINTLYSYKCMCPAGFFLGPDGQICEDVNECHTKENTCEQLCINIKGSFKCACNDGYILEDGGRCKLKDAASGVVGKDIASLVFSDKLDIRRVVLDSEKVGSFMSVVAARLNHATGLALNVRERKVFWTDLREQTINSMSMNRTHGKASSLIPLNSGLVLRNPYGLAVDWVNDHLYWTDYTAQSISVAYTNGSWPTLVRKTTGLSPGSIALHPGEGYIFVTAFGRNVSYIRRFDLSGGGGINIIAEEVRLPTGLTIDYDEERLFWADSKLHRLASSDFDGSDRQIILSAYNALRHPHGVALLFDKVYWTDRESRKLQSCNKWSCTNVTAVDAQLFSPMELQVDHPLAQPDFESVCAGHTCQFLCLPSRHAATDYVCVCPYGYKKSVTNRCIEGTKIPGHGPSPSKIPSKTPRGRTPHSSTSGNLVQPSVSTNVNKTNMNDERKGTGMHTGLQVAIGIAVVGFVGVLIFLAYNFHKRRSTGGKNYSNFHNPSYRKKSPHQNGKAAPFPSGIARNSSQAELMEVHSYSDQESGRNRVGSQDSSESPGSSNEHVYHPITCVPVDVEDESEPYINLSDKRILVS